MSLTTSYFASKAPRGRKVCIAKWNRFWSGPRAKMLAPSNPKATDWKASYIADLDTRFPTAQSLREYLDGILRETPGAILCCFERDPAECHRRVLAEYVYAKLGVQIEEYVVA